MDLIFITNELSLENLGVKQNQLLLSEVEENDLCFIKKIGDHFIHYVNDGEGTGSLGEDKNLIIGYLEKITEKKDYYIVNHTNQSVDITNFISSKVDSDRVFHGVHDLDDTKGSKHYKNLPKYLTDKNALSDWINELTGKAKEIKEHNDKLNIMHKLLGNKDLTEEEIEITVNSLPNYIDEISENKIESLKKLRANLLNKDI